MKNTKTIAKLLLQPALTSIGGPCKDWKSAVRLFSYGLLTKSADVAAAKHLRSCAACRLFLLACFNDQEEFIAHHVSQTAGKGTADKSAQIAFRLGSEKDAFIQKMPSSKTKNNLIPPSFNDEDESNPSHKDKKEDKNEKR